MRSRSKREGLTRIEARRGPPVSIGSGRIARSLGRRRPTFARHGSVFMSFPLAAIQHPPSRITTDQAGQTSPQWSACKPWSHRPNVPASSRPCVSPSSCTATVTTRRHLGVPQAERLTGRLPLLPEGCGRFRRGSHKEKSDSGAASHTQDRYRALSDHGEGCGIGVLVAARNVVSTSCPLAQRGNSRSPRLHRSARRSSSRLRRPLTGSRRAVACPRTTRQRRLGPAATALRSPSAT